MNQHDRVVHLLVQRFTVQVEIDEVHQRTRSLHHETHSGPSILLFWPHAVR